LIAAPYEWLMSNLAKSKGDRLALIDKPEAP